MGNGHPNHGDHKRDSEFWTHLDRFILYYRAMPARTHLEVEGWLDAGTRRYHDRMG
jgi:hypothetical protein